jgi:hypothetical protein
VRPRGNNVSGALPALRACFKTIKAPAEAGTLAGTQKHVKGKDVTLVFAKKAIWRCSLTHAVPTALGLAACTSAVHSFLMLPSRRKSPLQTAAGMLGRRTLASPSPPLVSCLTRDERFAIRGAICPFWRKREPSYF